MNEKRKIVNVRMKIGRKGLYLLLTILAYGFLLYKLVTYPHYNDLLPQLQSLQFSNLFFLLFVLLLMPLNLLAEALKWRYLTREVCRISVFDAIRSVLLGILGAFITPARVGDYPARVLPMQGKEKQLAAVSLGFIGSLSLSLVIVLIGLLMGSFFVQHYLPEYHYLIASSWALLVCLFVIVAFYPYVFRSWARRSEKHPTWRYTCEQISEFLPKRFITVTGYSLCRFLIFCLQLYCVLRGCGVSLTGQEALLAIPTYYLLVTITPSPPVADPAVRGSWAILVFGALSAQTIQNQQVLQTPQAPQIALATTLLWLINTVIPLIAAGFVKKHVF